jgi:hypothetical protein
MTIRKKAFTASNVAYRKPSVHDKGAIEKITKVGRPGDLDEPSSFTLIWADPVCPPSPETK